MTTEEMLRQVRILGLDYEARGAMLGLMTVLDQIDTRELQDQACRDFGLDPVHGSAYALGFLQGAVERLVRLYQA